MKLKTIVWAVAGVAAISAAALAVTVGDSAKLAFDQSVGPDPALPTPVNALVPTVDIADAKGWTDGAMPKTAQGLVVTKFAAGLKHPRWIYVLPNGDVLVAETDAPAKQPTGIKSLVMSLVMKQAGSNKGSANRISLLQDTDKDGVSDMRSDFLTNLNSPFGMALIGRGDELSLSRGRYGDHRR
jgi:glucose/arabinose dehydrogenase